MITVLLFLVFIAGITYQHYLRPSTRFAKPLNRFRVPIALICLMLVPFLFSLVLPSDGRSLSDREYLSYLEENAPLEDILETYEVLMQKDPNDLETRFEFIEHATSSATYDREGLATRTYSTNDTVNQQTRAFLQAYFFYGDSVKANPVKNAEYSNYILGIEKENQGSYLLAKLYYLQEMQNHPDNYRVRKKVLDFSRKHYYEDYLKYLQEEAFIQILPFHDQRFIYFRSGQWVNYLLVITRDSFDNIQFLAFIAALIISILWLLFLRSLDIFRMEKWRDILIVFALGTALAHACLFGYDFTHYMLGIQMSGNPLNDFVYCVIGIGVSEETVKLIPWVLFLLLTKKAKEPFDYLLYASVSALGFAFAENFSYLEDPFNITGRSIVSTVAHMFFSSLVAYGFILGRYKAKTRLLKIAYPLLGFVLACLAHGFYDFWIISPSVKAFAFITIVFFIVSLHLWFSFLNNAINNSPYYRVRSFNPIIQLDLLSVGIVSIFVIEFFFMSYEYGTSNAISNNLQSGWRVPVFLTYTIVLFSEFKIVPGRWRKFRFNFGRAFSVFTNQNRDSDMEYSTYEGLFLRLFVEKSNRFVGSKFPISGRCVGLITVSGSEDWSLFQIDTEFSFAGYRNDYVIIRTKSTKDQLTSDKVEILMLFLPVGTPVDGTPLHTQNLRFTGKAFSRPLQ